MTTLVINCPSILLLNDVDRFCCYRRFDIFVDDRRVYRDLSLAVLHEQYVVVTGLVTAQSDTLNVTLKGVLAINGRTPSPFFSLITNNLDVFFRDGRTC